jgi:hypothetical protein
MCFFERFFCKTNQIKSDTLTNALVKTDPEPEQELRCKLCNLTYEVSILPCKHTLCTGCVETQKLYIYGPCLVCANLNWNDLISTS